MQLEGQIQVFNQRLDLLALGADSGGFFLLFRLRRRLLRQLLPVSHDQRQRGADVVGDPGDPVGAGGVPAADQLVLLLQITAGLVQLLRQLGGRARLGQMDFLPLRQLPDSRRRLPQRLRAPPAEDQANGNNQTQIDDQQRPDPRQQCVEDVIVHVEIEPGHAPLLFPRHQQAKVIAVGHHRVVLQIPPGKSRDLRDGVGVVQFLRQIFRPQDFAVVPQQHRPRKMLLPFHVRGGGKAVVRPGEGLGELSHRKKALLLPFCAVMQHNADEQRPIDRKHQKRNAEGRQKVAEDHPGNRFHFVPSFASL